MKRGLAWAGLALCAPAVLLLVALPVGFVMELGKQVRLRVVNAGPRPLRVTLLDGERVAPKTLHPLLPLPAFRAVDLPVRPGAARVIYYSARRSAPRRVALRDDAGGLWEVSLSAAAGRRDVETGRELRLDAATPREPAGPSTRAALAGSPQAYPWAVLLAGPLGTLAFLRIRRFLNAG